MIQFLEHSAHTFPSHSPSPNSSSQPICNAHLSKGFDKLYTLNLGRNLRLILEKHRALFEEEAARPDGRPYKVQDGLKGTTIDHFDNAITCHTFGYASAGEYYAAASCDQRVPGIAVPTLFIQAADDPIAVASCIPRAELEKNPHTVLALTPTGGHLGWCCTELGVRGMFVGGVLAEKRRHQRGVGSETPLAALPNISLILKKPLHRQAPRGQMCR